MSSSISGIFSVEDATASPGASNTEVLPREVTTPGPLSMRLLADGAQDGQFATNTLALRNSAWSWYGEDVVVTGSDDIVLLDTARSEGSTQVRVVKLNG